MVPGITTVTKQNFAVFLGFFFFFFSSFFNACVGCLYHFVQMIVEPGKAATATAV